MERILPCPDTPPNLGKSLGTPVLSDQRKGGFTRKSASVVVNLWQGAQPANMVMSTCFSRQNYQDGSKPAKRLVNIKITANRIFIPSKIWYLQLFQPQQKAWLIPENDRFICEFGVVNWLFPRKWRPVVWWPRVAREHLFHRSQRTRGLPVSLAERLQQKVGLRASN